MVPLFLTKYVVLPGPLCSMTGSYVARESLESGSTFGHNNSPSNSMFVGNTLLLINPRRGGQAEDQHSQAKNKIHYLDDVRAAP